MKNKIYKVLKGRVEGFGGRHFPVDETCSDIDFPVGNADKLVKMGYLKEIDEETGETIVKTIDKYKDKSLTQWKKAELISELNNLGINHDPESNKPVLFDLLLNNSELETEEE